METLASGAGFTDSAVPQRMYVHSDTLGSTIAITDAARSKEVLSYDPWGKRRNSDGSDGADSLTATRDLHGYTGHEHLDAVKLIHMNGRVYDPTVARFISADPLVPQPANPQSLNRYSYVINNPLAYVDPSGFDFIGFGVTPRTERGGTGYGNNTATLDPITITDRLPCDRVCLNLIAINNLAAMSPNEAMRAMQRLLPAAERISVAVNRYGRVAAVAAYRAGAIAGFLALADGPLPIGDIAGVIVFPVLIGNAILNEANADPTQDGSHVGASALGADTKGTPDGPNGEDNKPSKPQVSDRKLQNYVDQYYKGVSNPNRIGSGTTADAVKHEIATGESVGGKWHTQKAQDLVRGLENWLRNNANALATDRAVAQNMVAELRGALGGR